MDPAIHERVRFIFDQVRKLPREQRAASLDQLCAGHADAASLRAEVESLLRSLDGAGEFMASPTVPVAGADDAMREATHSPISFASIARGGFGSDDAAAESTALRTATNEGPGTRIGPYKLLQQIGEGGFGVVFMAEQEQPVRRRVALKIIKLGMDTRQVVARFQAERQALAVMDHPNIAKVHDGGATDTGRPYFVMELVRGEPITKYCDVVEMPLRVRLELFVQVCHAVQHAHTKGIIHRDIKPSNVLVVLADGKPIPKVIDFGIAKATSGRLTEKTVVTEYRQVLGTPAYMSPEQANLNALDIDTRSDVYSLGVLLYELLTGQLPFDPTRLRSASLAELQRIIRDEEPPTPSSRISTLGANAGDVALRRRIDPPRLRRTLKGDVDWIVMKCLEKDRGRRYETASGLAAEVCRYLSGEPVLAAPPSRIYRLRKFVRRNRGAVAASTGFLLLLISATWVSLSFYLRADEQRSRADQNAQRSEKLARFQAAMLDGIDAKKLGRSIVDDIEQRVCGRMSRSPVDAGASIEQFQHTLARVNAVDLASRIMDEQVVGPAVHAIGREFGDEPLVEAALRSAAAGVYRKLGLYDKAVEQQQTAQSIRERELGRFDEECLQSAAALGQLLVLQGEFSGAESVLRHVCEARSLALPPDDPATLSALHDLAEARFMLGAPEAHGMLTDVLERRTRVLGPDHRDTLTTQYLLSWVLRARTEPVAAIDLGRQAFEGRRRTLGPDHPDTLDAEQNYAYALVIGGREAEAAPLQEDVYRRNQRAGGDNHPGTLSALVAYAGSLSFMGRTAEAVSAFDQVIAGFRDTLGDDHLYTINAEYALGKSLTTMGRLTEAGDVLERALERSRRALGPAHNQTLGLLHRLANVRRAQQRPADAESLWRECIQSAEQSYGREDRMRLRSLQGLGELLTESGRADAGEAMLRDAFEVQHKKFGPQHPDTVPLLLSLFDCLRRNGREVELEADLAAAIANPSVLPPPARALLPGCFERLIRLCERSGRTEQAARLMSQLAAWQTSTQPAAAQAASLP